MKRILKNSFNKFNKFYQFSIYTIFIFLPSLVFAATSGKTAIDQALSSLLDYLNSTIARLVALLAIAGVGYATLYLGKMPKQKAIAVVIGIAIIFGGAKILSMLHVGK